MAGRVYKAYGVSILLHCMLLVVIMVYAPLWLQHTAGQEEIVEVELMSLSSAGIMSRVEGVQTDPSIQSSLQSSGQNDSYDDPEHAVAGAVQDGAIPSGTNHNSNGAVSRGGTGNNSVNEGSPASIGSAGNQDEPNVFLPPAVLNRVEAHYPDYARAKGIEGRVVVRIQVSENGSVGDVSVYSSSGYSDLDESAVQAVRQWRFIPSRNQRTGAAVSCYTKLAVVFSLT